MADISQINLPDGNTYNIKDASATDTKVTQTNTTSSANYRVLLSGTADDTDRTEGVNKSFKLKFKPEVASGTNVGFRFKDGTHGDWTTDQVCGLLDISGFGYVNVRLCGDGTVATVCLPMTFQTNTQSPRRAETGKLLKLVQLGQEM